MNPDRRAAFLTGALFIATFVTSIAAMLLYKPTLDAPGELLSAGADSRILLGGLLEMLLIVANIGTAVVLYPILRRKEPTVSLSYVSARLVECAFIATGLLSMLTLVSLNQNPGGTDDATLEAVGRMLIQLHDWTFLLGPGWIVGLGNGLLLGYVMYRHALVPRPMASLGLIGGPLILLSGTAILLGLSEAGELPQVVATVPEFIWEASLGIYLMVRGFKSPVPATG